jgi:DNA-binding NtrC family response regulator
MPKINQAIESFARIMVLGIGGSGKNAVNHMIHSKVKGVSFICMNTGAVTTIGNTSGVLFSAGAFNGGNKAVSSGNVVTVTYSVSL